MRNWYNSNLQRCHVNFESVLSIIEDSKIYLCLPNMKLITFDCSLQFHCYCTFQFQIIPDLQGGTPVPF